MTDTPSNPSPESNPKSPRGLLYGIGALVVIGLAGSLYVMKKPSDSGTPVAEATPMAAVDPAASGTPDAGAANVGRFGDSDLTLNARTAVAAARALGEAVIVPAHAEGWHHFSETRERLVREFEYSGLAHRLRVPQHGVPLELS